ncbi:MULTISPECIES: tRNA pseudouridine(38-40) synthase TruA [unclassified Microbacterium]|uniref:tRNA pseudouridine(38-40) synthase TruA n=1 Tax=unclassified Microbacterium TaxID=2609290 RepID=UPI0038690B6F
MRLRIDLAYDGTDFRGWARQPNLRTVQGTLEAAIARILGGDPRLVVAGRTDAGVHAAGQVCHLDLTDGQQTRLRAGRHPDPSALAGRINGVLGSYSDVAVHRVAVAPEGFDARFSAVWRRYSYRLADRTGGYDPLDRLRTTFVNATLDVEAMDAAANSLRGLHDFAAYCKPRDEATTIRTLLEYDWRRDDSGVLIANVRADAFCHSMVRALVGACVAVGQGKIGLDRLVEIRDAVTRTNDFTVLAARGLTLAEVGYPADELLAARAEQTRARRELDPATDAE